MSRIKFLPGDLSQISIFDPRNLWFQSYGFKCPQVIENINTKEMSNMSNNSLRLLCQIVGWNDTVLEDKPLVQFESRPLEGESVRPSYLVVIRQSTDQHLHLTRQIHGSLWTPTSEMSGSIVHCTESNLIDKKCCCREFLLKFSLWIMWEKSLLHDFSWSFSLAWGQ